MNGSIARLGMSLHRQQLPARKVPADLTYIVLRIALVIVALQREPEGGARTIQGAVAVGVQPGEATAINLAKTEFREAYDSGNF